MTKDAIYIYDKALSLLTGVFNLYDSSTGIFKFPLIPNVRLHQIYAESFVRSFLLAVPLIIRTPDLVINGYNVKQMFINQLLLHTDPANNFNLKLNPNSFTPQQETAEAGILALCLLETKLMYELSDTQKQQVVKWFEQFIKAKINFNNWRWFRIFINLFLKLNNGQYNPDYFHDLRCINEQYYHGGWYLEVGKFDQYCAWGMQFFPVFLIKYEPDLKSYYQDWFDSRNQIFLERYAHFFSRNGKSLPWGRSLCYRFAAVSPYSVAYTVDRKTFDVSVISPGFARYLVVNNIKRFFEQDILKNGILSLGFLSEDMSLIDDYTCSASPLYAATAFWCLNLPDDNIFWTAPENRGFWDIDYHKIPSFPREMKIFHTTDGETYLEFKQQKQKGLQIDTRYIGPFSTIW